MVIPLGKSSFRFQAKNCRSMRGGPSHSMPDPAEPVMEVVLCVRQDKIEARGNAAADYAQAR
jgi:hypothetical protein